MGVLAKSEVQKFCSKTAGSGDIALLRKPCFLAYIWSMPNSMYTVGGPNSGRFFFAFSARSAKM